MFDSEDLLPEGAFILVAGGARRLFVWLGSDFAVAEGVSDGAGDASGGSDDDEGNTAASIARKIADEARTAVRHRPPSIV